MSLVLNLFNRIPKPNTIVSYPHRITSIIRESPDVWTYRMVPVSPVDPLQYIPGQFLHLMVPGGDAGQREARHMSIASHPDEPFIQCSMDLSSQSSYKQAFRRIRKGDRVEVFRVKGHFTLEPVVDHSRYIFIAGGVGITPFRSLILEMEKQERLDSCRLLHVGRTHLYQEEHLLRLGNQVTFAGRQDVPALMDDVTASHGDNWPWYYICGSNGFIEGMRNHLIERMVPEERIRMEYFSH